MKESYETPKLTRFGSVASLTLVDPNGSPIFETFGVIKNGDD